MRARLTSWSAIGVSSRRGKLWCGALAVLWVGAICFGGLAIHRAKLANEIGQARREWRDSEAMRTATRYGDVKLPLRGETCTSYAFDNWQGGFVDERITECEPPKPPRSMTLWDSSGGTVARVNGIAAGFKRQQ